MQKDFKEFKELLSQLQKVGIRSWEAELYIEKGRVTDLILYDFSSEYKTSSSLDDFWVNSEPSHSEALEIHKEFFEAVFESDSESDSEKYYAVKFKVRDNDVVVTCRSNCVLPPCIGLTLM